MREEKTLTLTEQTIGALSRAKDPSISTLILSVFQISLPNTLKPKHFPSVKT